LVFFDYNASKQHKAGDKMKSSKTPLPDYERPPVIEVVCGIQYKPLTAFQATSFGLFWQKIRDNYLKVEEAAPLNPVIEPLTSESKRMMRPEVRLFDTPPLPRLLFYHREPYWLLQLQQDRFLHNWRKEDDGNVYPRYPVVYKKFWNAWEQYLSFLSDEKIEPPVINQLEISYINHIPAGQGWNTLADLGKMFRDVGWVRSNRFLPSPESVNLRWTFMLPDSQGRLHVSIKHAVRVTDNHPVLLCELTARGMPASDNKVAIKDWFALGREWIVRGFADIIDMKTQKEQWGRKV
jgi:uncharacterized protein (TIGR04255 family)